VSHRAKQRARSGLALSAIMLAASGLGGCQKFETWLFERNSPTVDRAMVAIQSNDAGDAHRALAEYLGTGRCKEGLLGTPDSLRALPNAGVDLGLALFALAERYGEKFGELPPETAEEQQKAGPELAKRSQEVDCAQRLVRIVAQDKHLPVMLRAQAYYLSGNLDFLRHDFEAAVASYESALELVPAGASDAGDDVGERAAYNRAIAKRRAEEQKKDPPDPPDGGAPPPSDAGGEPNPDQKDPKDPEQKDPEQKDPEDEQKDPKDSQDQQPNGQGGTPNQPPPADSGTSQDGQNGQPKPADSAAPSGSATPPSRPSLSQDEQILELLERAPLIQQELPKARGRVLGRSSMEDK
jgi:hypothetical protein